MAYGVEEKQRSQRGPHDFGLEKMAFLSAEVWIIRLGLIWPRVVCWEKVTRYL